MPQTNNNHTGLCRLKNSKSTDGTTENEVETETKETHTNAYDDIKKKKKNYRHHSNSLYPLETIQKIY
jgi:hypothetical protein